VVLLAGAVDGLWDRTGGRGVFWFADDVQAQFAVAGVTSARELPLVIGRPVVTPARLRIRWPTS